jgi:hypothetical protein
LAHRRVVARDSHGGEQLLGDVVLARAMDTLAGTVGENVPLRRLARGHLFHVAATDLLQRLAREDMDVPRLAVHRRWRALGILDDLADHRLRHRLVPKTPDAAAAVHQLLKIHEVLRP